MNDHLDAESEKAGNAEDCTSLAEVRERIDRIDNEIVSLLSARSRLVKKAGSFKRNEGEVAAPNRVEQIVRRVRERAVQMDVNPDIVEAVYRQMIECFTREEVASVRNRKC